MSGTNGVRIKVFYSNQKNVYDFLNLRFFLVDVIKLKITTKKTFEIYPWN